MDGKNGIVKAITNDRIHLGCLGQQTLGTNSHSEAKSANAEKQIEN